MKLNLLEIPHALLNNLMKVLFDCENIFFTPKQQKGLSISLERIKGNTLLHAIKFRRLN